MKTQMSLNLERTADRMRQDGFDALLLQIRRGVSHGTYTGGYAVCTLYADGLRVATCHGGGYDLAGTVLGALIEAVLADDLRRVDPTLARKNGMTISDESVLVDGGCGVSCVQTLAAACGWSLTALRSRPSGDRIYLLRKED